MLIIPYVCAEFHDFSGNPVFRITPAMRGTMVEAPEAIVRITEIQVNVFPNPAVDFVNISMEENESATLILTDMQGKIVKRGTITGEGTIPVRDLAAGLYLLRLQNDKGIAVRKIQVR